MEGSRIRARCLTKGGDTGGGVPAWNAYRMIATISQGVRKIKSGRFRTQNIQGRKRTAGVISNGNSTAFWGPSG